MGVAPPIEMDIQRIGRPSSGNRPLKVTIANNNTQKEILDKAKSLKNNQNLRNIYIQKDHDVITRKENGRLRSALKTLRQDKVDSNVTMEYGKIKVDGETIDFFRPFPNIFPFRA